MARILVISAELMLGTRVVETLGACGHEAQLAGSVPDATDLADVDAIVADVAEQSPAAVAGLGRPVLGYYQHTDAARREEAEAAGVAIVVPRSRLVREMPELVERLLGG